MSKKVGNYEQIYQGIDPKTGKEIWKYKHRIEAGAKPGQVVHHKNGNPHDNSRDNLQVTTKAGHNKIDPKHHLGGRKKGGK